MVVACSQDASCNLTLHFMSQKNARWNVVYAFDHFSACLTNLPPNLAHYNDRWIGVMHQGRDLLRGPVFFTSHKTLGSFRVSGTVSRRFADHKNTCYGHTSRSAEKRLPSADRQMSPRAILRRVRALITTPLCTLTSADYDGA
jgi:hypothetical protein